ncbi:hypothetical protein DK104_07870 [Salmonella enterica subsp. enterica serovar Lexington]|nr:hypothetical protein [Salmonella enterica subsp. enterica serovar Lexington]
MMDKVFSAVQYILGLGPTVMLPIIIFIMAMCLQTGFSRAIRSALTIGMGFIGIFLVFGLLVDSLGPAAKEMVNHTGIDLPVVDLGWTPLAAIAWASQIAPFVVPMTIGINVLMLTLNWTKTVDIDVWNFWHFSMVGAMVYGVTGNFFFGLLIAGATAAITFVMADWCAPMIQKYFNLPGISLPTLSSVIFFPIGVLGNMVLDKVPGINKLNADPDQIQKRFGVFGEPMMLGVILGAGIGLLAEYDFKGVLNLAMSLGAVMLIMPRMVKLLMEGLLPLSDAVRSFLKKRYPDRQDMSAFLRMVDTLRNEQDMAVASALDGIFIPHLRGSGPPDRNTWSRALIYGLDDKSRPQDVLRFVFQGLCFELRNLLDLYETLTGNNYPVVNVIGAACKNPYWLQLKANILNREIVACNVNEAVSKGAAMLAAKAVGVEVECLPGTSEEQTRRYLPESDAVTHYQAIYTQVYKPLYESKMRTERLCNGVN